MLTAKAIGLLLPEIVLVATAVVLYLRGCFCRPAPSEPHDPLAEKNFSPDASKVSQDVRSMQIALVGVVLAGWALARLDLPVEQPRTFFLDQFSLYVRWLSLTSVGLLVLLGSAGGGQKDRPEYLGTLLLSGAGAMAVAVADNLVLLFVALELVSIPTYILLCVGRRDVWGAEAAAKYFFLSLLASALLIYGMSFLYGASGSLQLKEIRSCLSGSPGLGSGLTGFVKLALALLLAGLGFKIAAVPFHFYAPDVYEGTSYPNGALLSVMPKIAGFTALLRILGETLPGGEEYVFGWRVVLALAVLTMTVGNLVGLWQQQLRRLLAYSSIGQAGYILAGLAVGLGGADVGSRVDGLGAVLLYLAVYALATLGAFSVLETLRCAGQSVENLQQLRGLAQHRPWAAAWLSIFMFSLTGLPPLAGFWGKWAVVFGAIKTSLSLSTPSAQSFWFMGLAAITMLNAAVAAGYYLRVVAAVYFWPPTQTPSASGFSWPWIAAVICGLLCIGLGLFPWPIWNAAGHAVESLAFPESSKASLTPAPILQEPFPIFSAPEWSCFQFCRALSYLETE
ncbi:MAG: NADH-quinone oxidoreductase subunit N [Thermoguttaceae bacterium]|nr:NADH-quinone oxidoreductase subunit N [Thermoguttaceae bacterium]MDW8038745.1 NADH-quinone oxidoreductase subunit N [Thermoguttaceae bacterium]